MKSQPWILAYSRPTSIFLSDVESQTRTNIILVISTLFIVVIISAFVGRNFASPIISLTKIANSISQGDLSARAQIKSTDEIGTLASAFNSMTDQLQTTLIGLEERISERTADLQKSNLELETIADVAREISTIRDLDTLLNVSASLIRQRLSYYHVGIFLVDQRGEYAILRAASSIAAEQMLANNYKLRVGQTGLVGNVTRTGTAYIALDVGLDAVHFENPLLPETRSEITLPLRSHNITIGALDIQASIPTAFDKRDTQTLQILADQLAAAIENAQLVQQVEGTLRELTSTNRLQSQQTWHSAISQQERPAFEYDGLQVRAVPQNLPDDLLRQLESGKPIVFNTGVDHNEGKSTLIIPLLVLNQIIGVIGLEQEDSNHIWTDEEIAVAQAAANRAALTLENSRLLEESQRRAVKERTIFEATTRIGSAVNIENILQATAEELERVLSGSEVILQFKSENDSNVEK
jgi:GAF domain-containing protein/HAMP domain-containing protein